MITSVKNPKVKYARALQDQASFRRCEGAFVCEGVRLVEEALAVSWPAKYILYTRGLNKRGQAVLRGFAQRGVPVEEITEEVMQKVSETQTPQGILAIMSVPAARDVLIKSARMDFMLILDQVRDPGNLGTILRTAEAAGVNAVLTLPGTTDLYAPKVVRAGMGAHFRLPVLALSWEEIDAVIAGLRVFLAASRQGVAYTQADFRQPLALLLGGEAEGVSARAETLAHERVHIPILGKSESLNVAVAAGILIFEVIRQRARGV